ncbi:MAG: M15 family metallopeptidase [Spirochaetia bacterium]
MKKNKLISPKSCIFALLGGCFFLFLTPLEAKSKRSQSIFASYGIQAADLRRAPASIKDDATLAEIASLLRAYPNDISRLRYADGDWIFVFPNSQELYWAHGRLLPKALRKNYKRYRKYISYRYPKEPEDPRLFSFDRIARIKNETHRQSRASAPAYEGSFHEMIYRNYDRQSIEAQLVKVTLLGRKISVHKKVGPALTRVNRQINQLAKKNSRISRFTKQVRSVQSYSWRRMRGTSSMSFHSLGVAVDILPKNRQRIIYWGWEAPRNPDWLFVPPEKKWIPPKEILEIFEENGFIWGGKWILYDNMHFEYRPELLILQELEEKIH